MHQGDTIARMGELHIAASCDTSAGIRAWEQRSRPSRQRLLLLLEVGVLLARVQTPPMLMLVLPLPLLPLLSLLPVAGGPAPSR